MKHMYKILIILLCLTITTNVYAAKKDLTDNTTYDTPAKSFKAADDNDTELYDSIDSIVNVNSVEVTTTGATLNLDYTATKLHTVTFNQDCAVSITNWPTSGLVGTVGVRCINANGFTVTIEGKSLTFATNRELVVLISTDGGTTVDATISSLE